jgi:hypothetical protein
VTCIQAGDGKIVNHFLQCRNSLIAGTGSEQGTREGSGSEGQHNDCRYDSQQQTGTAGCILLCNHGKISTYTCSIKIFKKGSGAKSYMSKCYLINEEMRKYLVIFEEVSSLSYISFHAILSKFTNFLKSKYAFSTELKPADDLS